MPLWEYVKYNKETKMYHDEIFENALKDVKEESYKALKLEISSMEATIEKFLKNVLECTTFKAESEFNLGLG